MDEKQLTTAAYEMARVTIGQAVLDLLRQGQTLGLPELIAFLQRERDRVSPQSMAHHMNQAALQKLEEFPQGSHDRTS